MQDHKTGPEVYNTINESECGPYNYPLPVMVSSQCGRVPREEDFIMDSPGKVVQAIHIIQIHSWVSITTCLVVLLGFAMLLHAVEQFKGEDLIGNNSLPIEIIGAHDLENMEEFILGV